jgi:coproporphyrinogen III oxidase
VKYGAKYVSLKTDDPYTITPERALEVIREKEIADANRLILDFPDAGIQVLNGRYGPYITDKERNAKIPKDKDPKTLTLEECQALLAAAPLRTFGKWGRKGKGASAKAKNGKAPRQRRGGRRRRRGREGPAPGGEDRPPPSARPRQKPARPEEGRRQAEKSRRPAQRSKKRSREKERRKKNRSQPRAWTRRRQYLNDLHDRITPRRRGVSTRQIPARCLAAARRRRRREPHPERRARVRAGRCVVLARLRRQDAAVRLESRPEMAGRAVRGDGPVAGVSSAQPVRADHACNVRFLVATPQAAAPVWWFGGGFDLTPYYPFDEDVLHWHRTRARPACRSAPTVREVQGWCDRYFFLPHRNETRGVGGLFFDDLNEGGFDRCFAFCAASAIIFCPATCRSWNAAQGTPAVPARPLRRARAHAFSLYRRGRYVEFNLVYDRGTFLVRGCSRRGRTESILDVGCRRCVRGGTTTGTAHRQPAGGDRAAVAPRRVRRHAWSPAAPAACCSPTRRSSCWAARSPGACRCGRCATRPPRCSWAWAWCFCGGPRHELPPHLPCRQFRGRRQACRPAVLPAGAQRKDAAYFALDTHAGPRHL